MVLQFFTFAIKTLGEYIMHALTILLIIYLQVMKAFKYMGYMGMIIKLMMIIVWD